MYKRQSIRRPHRRTCLRQSCVPSVRVLPVSYTHLLDGNLHVRGEEDAYRETVKRAVGGAAGVTHESVNAHTSCEPNRNVEAMRVCLDKAGIESRPLWKPMYLTSSSIT